MKAPRQRAVKARRPLHRGEAALLALRTALNAIDAPAFVIDLGGAVLHASTNAQALLDRDRRAIAQSLTRAIAGAPADRGWELRPLRGSHKARGFLAILRARPRESSVADLHEAASQRWHLTMRQRQVLELVVRGFTNSLIADSLGIGEGTVEFHLSAIFDKAGIASRAMLIARVLAGSEQGAVTFAVRG